MSTTFDSYCGLDCAACSFKASAGCGGCIATGGKPFHGRCEVADCANSRQRRFCGECSEFPCVLLTRYAYDPAHGDNGARIARCQAIKQQLVADARKELNPVGVCGHHCDHCPYTPWCGGCRSEYHCCSFATLYEDGLCPNVSCAQARQLSGCWQCPELEHCGTGYFGAEDGYTAKAAALYIRSHGTQAYAGALEGLTAAGRSLKESGSLTTALAWLKDAAENPDRSV